MTHTKQEWRQGGGIHITTIYDHLMNKVIAYTKDSEGEANGISKEEAQANAERIVKCVNGWDGIMKELTLYENTGSDLLAENAKLKGQVEKLQSSLKMAMHELQHLSNNSTTGEIIAKIKQVL